VMPPVGVSVGALAVVVLASSALGYLLGHFSGTRSERRRWQRRISDEVRALGRTRAMVRRALESKPPEAIT